MILPTILSMMITILVFHMKARNYVAMYHGQVVGVNGLVMYHCLKLLFLDHVFMVMEHQGAHVAIVVLIWIIVS